MYTLLGSPFGRLLPSHSRTICAPPDSPSPFWPGYARGTSDLPGSVTSTMEVPLFSTTPEMRVELGLAAMVADIRDPAVALLVDHRLVGAARLQAREADEPHVARLRLVRAILARAARPVALATGQCRAQQQRSRDTDLAHCHSALPKNCWAGGPALLFITHHHHFAASDQRSASILPHHVGRLRATGGQIPERVRGPSSAPRRATCRTRQRRARRRSARGCACRCPRGPRCR